jgi:hypothetical protein
MIELIVEDEYGQHFATETFLTVQDAKDYLNTLDCALDDADTSTEVYRLRGLISQLEESIMQAELQEEE